MYDPGVQTALLEALARWGRLPEGDLLTMLAPADRLRFRAEALHDLAGDGLVTLTPSGDDAIVALTDAGAAWLAGRS